MLNYAAYTMSKNTRKLKRHNESAGRDVGRAHPRSLRGRIAQVDGADILTTTRNRPPSTVRLLETSQRQVSKINVPARIIAARCCPSRAACLADIQLACSSAACKKSFFSERRILPTSPVTSLTKRLFLYTDLNFTFDDNKLINAFCWSGSLHNVKRRLALLRRKN